MSPSIRTPVLIDASLHFKYYLHCHCLGAPLTPTMACLIFYWFRCGLVISFTAAQDKWQGGRPQRVSLPKCQTLT